MHIIEEMELFDKPQPVQNIILDSKKVGDGLKQGQPGMSVQYAPCN